MPGKRETFISLFTLRRKGPVFPIIFEEVDVLPPYDDSLVVTVKTAYCEVRRVLVDNGSSLDLL